MLFYFLDCNKLKTQFLSELYKTFSLNPLFLVKYLQVFELLDIRIHKTLKIFKTLLFISFLDNSYTFIDIMQFEFRLFDFYS